MQPGVQCLTVSPCSKSGPAPVNPQAGQELDWCCQSLHPCFCQGQDPLRTCLAPSAMAAMALLVLQAALSCHCADTMERSVFTARSPSTR